jgi:integrase
VSVKLCRMVQGVPARVVQEILGHAHVSTTLGIYSHVIPSLKRDAADKMNTLLAPVEKAVSTPGASSGVEG